MTRQDVSARAGQQTFSVSGHVTSILGFAGHMVSIRMTHLLLPQEKGQRHP